MSRWIQDFNQSALKAIWSTLMEDLEKLDVDDQTVTTTVEELARLKKVLVFVNSIISNADLELTPKSVWSSCQSQSEQCLQQVNHYSTNRNPAHLVQANEHADNILTYVRPYMVAPEQALKAYGVAVKVATENISEYVRSFQDQATKVSTAIAQALDESISKRNEIEAIEERVKQFNDYMFIGTEGEKPAEEDIKTMVSDVEAKHSAVESLHNKLLEGPNSTSDTIISYEQHIIETSNSLDELQTSSKSKHKELEQFYEKIFGRQMADSSDLSDQGLKKELDDRLTQLDAYEIAQKSRQSALFQSIETLLPGATNASLASAYMALKDRFTKPISKYTAAFYASMSILLLGGLTLITDNVTLWPLHIEFVKVSNWDEMLRTLLMRAPIILPVIWLAIFSATRRSQYERLQQEYAHKEALASSYESYRKQLKELDGDTENLQKELIAKAIEAIAYNASKTLDGKHTEKLPLSQLLENLITADELKKFVEIIKGKNQSGS